MIDVIHTGKPVEATGLPMAPAVWSAIATRPAVRPFRSDDCAGLCPEALEAIHGAPAEAGSAYRQFGKATWNISRLMCSFDTESSEVDGLLGVVESVMTT